MSNTEVQEVSRESLKIQSLLNTNLGLTNENADLRVELHVASEESARLRGRVSELEKQLEESNVPDKTEPTED